MKSQSKPSDDRPPNSNSVLKNLPDERRDQIAAWCAKANDLDADSQPIPLTGGLAYAQLQLAADGLKVSLPSLSEFCRWYRARRRHRRSLATLEQVRQMAAEIRPGDATFAREAAEITLLAQATESEDPEQLALATRIHDQRRSLDLTEASAKTKAAQKAEQLAQGRVRLGHDAERIVLLRFDASKAVLANLAALKAISRDASLNADAKIAAVQLKLFGPVPPEFAEKFNPEAKG